MAQNRTYSDQIPDPGRFEALAGPWRVEYHDEHPDVYELSGAVAGENDWDAVEAGNRAHLTLRREAIERVPEMLAELTEALDLLIEDGDRDEYVRSGSPEDAEKRRGALARDIRATLRDLDRRGAEYGLEAFAVVCQGEDGLELAEGRRYESVADAERRAEELNAAADEQERPFSVLPAKLSGGLR